MSIQIKFTGKDDLASFEGHLPGFCYSCEKETAATIKYSAHGIISDLKKRSIEVKTPAIILKKPWEIGITCGCYARFQRQVAHIQRKKNRG